jgi:hypothetical protein
LFLVKSNPVDTPNENTNHNKKIKQGGLLVCGSVLELEYDDLL